MKTAESLRVKNYHTLSNMDDIILQQNKQEVVMDGKKLAEHYVWLPDASTMI